MPAETSIIIPVRNGATYIAAAIGSALPQLEPDDEIIVIDDGSTDESCAVVRSIDDPRLRLLAAPQPGGVAAARNVGLAAATGRFIAFLDCDDEWPPGRHAAMRAYLLATPDAGGVSGRLKIQVEPGASANGYDAADGKFAPNGVLGTGLFRQEAIKTAGGFSEDMLSAEDVDFYNRMDEAGVKFHLIDLPALIYRRHSANMTNDREFVRRWFMEMLRRKLARARAAGYNPPC